MLLWRRETRVQLALLLGISLRTLGRRIAGELRWEAGELQRMADHFGVPVSRFYDGPDALLGGSTPPER